MINKFLFFQEISLAFETISSASWEFDVSDDLFKLQMDRNCKTMQRIGESYNEALRQERGSPKVNFLLETSQRLTESLKVLVDAVIKQVRTLLKRLVRMLIYRLA